MVVAWSAVVSGQEERAQTIGLWCRTHNGARIKKTRVPATQTATPQEAQASVSSNTPSPFVLCPPQMSRNQFLLGSLRWSHRCTCNRLWLAWDNPSTGSNISSYCSLAGTSGKGFIWEQTRLISSYCMLNANHWMNHWPWLHCYYRSTVPHLRPRPHNVPRQVLASLVCWRSWLCEGRMIHYTSHRGHHSTALNRIGW